MDGLLPKSNTGVPDLLVVFLDLLSVFHTFSNFIMKSCALAILAASSMSSSLIDRPSSIFSRIVPLNRQGSCCTIPISCQ